MCGWWCLNLTSAEIFVCLINLTKSKGGMLWISSRILSILMLYEMISWRAEGSRLNTLLSFPIRSSTSPWSWRRPSGGPTTANRFRISSATCLCEEEHPPLPSSSSSSASPPTRPLGWHFLASHVLQQGSERPHCCDPFPRRSHSHTVSDIFTQQTRPSFYLWLHSVSCLVFLFDLCFTSC